MVRRLEESAFQEANASFRSSSSSGSGAGGGVHFSPPLVGSFGAGDDSASVYPGVLQAEVVGFGAGNGSFFRAPSFLDTLRAQAGTRWEERSSDDDNDNDDDSDFDFDDNDDNDEDEGKNQKGGGVSGAATAIATGTGTYGRHTCVWCAWRSFRRATQVSACCRSTSHT